VNPSGTSANCVFALAGTTTGTYDVVVSNPDGTSFTKSGGFAIQSGTGPNIWVNVTGRSAIRFNTPTTFSISYGNTGDTDALGVPIFVSVPQGVTLTVLSKLVNAPAVPLLDPASIPTVVPVNGQNVLPLLIPRIPAGGSGTIFVQMNAPSSATDASISAYNWQPFGTSAATLAQGFGTYQSGSYTANVRVHAQDLSSLSLHPMLLEPELQLDPNAAAKCIQDLTLLGLQIAGQVFPPAQALQCGAQLAGFLGNAITTLINSNQAGYGPGDAGSDLSQLYASGGQAALSCIEALGGSTPVGMAANTILALIQASLQGAQALQDCNDVAKPNNPQMKPVKPVGAIDPNYKAGPVGDGSASKYLQGGKSFTYNLGFENEATATAPASQVVVTDQLDPTKVDLSTVTLGTISFGSTVINLPANTNIYNTVYKLSSTLNVRIAGSLDTASGLLKWTFTSIDPSTGQPPTDPTVGFLPPDADGIVGQGSVLFNVMPKAGQGTGTVINNQANIVFDSNAAIATPLWTNTLDVDAPTSSVTALAPRIQALTFPVSWSGTDKGSGIATYTIYVSDNSGAYTVWQQAVTAKSASFTGVTGHTYGFYSIATDAAGNVQAAKTSADTTTTVGVQAAPLATTTALSASSTSVASGSSVTLTAIVSPPAGTTTVPTGTVTFMNGSTTLGSSSVDGTGKATLATAALPVGTNGITAQYGGDANFAGSTSSSVSVVVGTPNFSVSLNPTTASMHSGGSATSTVTVTPAFGFASAVTLTCSGLPTNSTCAFSASSVTPTGGAAATSTLTISTGVQASAVPAIAQEGHRLSGKVASGVLFSILMAPWGMLGMRRRWGTKRRGHGVFLLLIAAGVIVIMSGCGGSGGGSTTTSTTTPTGTSTVTVTATAGSVTQTATLQLTVN
jgi:Bacterial Ig-like domain (group 3)